MLNNKLVFLIDQGVFMKAAGVADHPKSSILCVRAALGNCRWKL
jgi:hypothetical protein